MSCTKSLKCMVQLAIRIQNCTPYFKLSTEHAVNPNSWFKLCKICTSSLCVRNGKIYPSRACNAYETPKRVHNKNPHLASEGLCLDLHQAVALTVRGTHCQEALTVPLCPLFVRLFGAVLSQNQSATCVPAIPTNAPLLLRIANLLRTKTFSIIIS